MNKSPTISVLMSTYNTPEEWLCEAIESILNQTFSDFEFIIMDDCSTESIDSIKSKYNDPRIIWVRNDENLGLTKSLNKLLRMARGKYIARMDADDISLAQRFEIQLDFMDKHPEVIVSGSYRRAFGNESKDEIWNIPKSREEQQVQLFFSNCGLTHPTAMFRRSMLEEYGITYNESYIKAQDYGIWVQCTRYAPMAMIPKVLLQYRKSNQQISAAGKQSQKENSGRVKTDQLKLLGIDATEKEKKMHLSLCLRETDVLPSELEKWIFRLKKANRETHYFNDEIFEAVLSRQWYNWCKKAYKEDGRKDAKAAYKRAATTADKMKDAELAVKRLAAKIIRR